MDVDAHREVAASFGVRSVPFVTLLSRGAWFSHDADGEPVALPAVRYEGPLAAGPTVEWINNRCEAHAAWNHLDGDSSITCVSALPTSAASIQDGPGRPLAPGGGGADGGGPGGNQAGGAWHS